MLNQWDFDSGAPDNKTALDGAKERERDRERKGGRLSEVIAEYTVSVIG